MDRVRFGPISVARFENEIGANGHCVVWVNDTESQEWNFVGGVSVTCVAGTLLV